MKIPYANSNFASIRREGYFYVDKTPFFPHLENADGNYLIFLRPRRFGKSTLLRTLELYYDIATASEFDELFGGLWIHENPTPEKNKYLILRLDFSPVLSDGTSDEIRRSFATQVLAPIWAFTKRYEALIPELASIEVDMSVSSTDHDTAAAMTKLLTIVERAGHQVYLLIDEYDHFGNRMLSDGMNDAYQDLVRSTGFVRSFYASLKAFTTKGTLARMFVTGVSPIMLDDLSSGFNIITHISLDDTFNAIAGFTRADVERAVNTLLTDKPQLAKDPRIGDREVLLETLEKHYNGYRFSKHAADRMYNSTLVLYFLRKLSQSGRYPDQMLDMNVRTDYGRLYAIAKAASGLETGTRELLDKILTNEYITTSLVEQFGTKLAFGPEQIVSLFYYMGMLTFADDTASMDEPKLVIPNKVMRDLQWGYMALALSDHDGIRIDTGLLASALRNMATNGDVQPFVEVFHSQVIKRMSNRDLMNFDEKTMKLMLIAYLSQTQVFRIASELELNQGYCDLLLGLRGDASPNKYAWIIEAKYVKTDATAEVIEKAVDEGYAQLDKYTADKALVAMLTLGHDLKSGVLLFVGLKDVVFRPWPKET